MVVDSSIRVKASLQLLISFRRFEQLKQFRVDVATKKKKKKKYARGEEESAS